MSELEQFMKADEPKKAIPFSYNELEVLRVEHKDRPWTNEARLLATIDELLPIDVIVKNSQDV
jgi:hypothetical protein